VASLSSTSNSTFGIPLNNHLQFAIISCLGTMKDTPESIARIGLGTSSFADNVETPSESEAAKPTLARVEGFKQLAGTRRQEVQ
jgi:hypothetical protein